jgi:hypothetical protein
VSSLKKIDCSIDLLEKEWVCNLVKPGFQTRWVRRMVLCMLFLQISIQLNFCHIDLFQLSDVAPNTEVHEKNLNSELEFYGTIQPANLLL